MSWTWAPATDLLVVLAVGGYLALVLHHRRAHHRWPMHRVACAVAAAATLIVASNGALAVYGHQLFWVHMVVHLLLIMVVPALAVFAQPVRLLHDAGGPSTRRVIDRVVERRGVRLLVSPWLTVPAYAAVLVLTHLTGFQQAMSEHMWIHDGEQLLYLTVGYLLFFPLLGGEFTGRWAIAPFLRFVVLAICMGPDTLVGVALMMTSSPIAPAYAASRDWGPTALADQSQAGAIMWFGGDGLMMILMVLVGGLWVGAGNRAASLGPWLDRIRTQSTLGAAADPSVDIDDDEAALLAYNARLKALHANTIHSGPKGAE